MKKIRFPFSYPISISGGLLLGTGVLFFLKLGVYLIILIIIILFYPYYPLLSSSSSSLLISSERKLKERIESTKGSKSSKEGSVNPFICPLQERQVKTLRDYNKTLSNIQSNLSESKSIAV